MEGSDIVNKGGDDYRVGRDGAFVRTEYMQNFDLQGYCLQDLNNIENYFHVFQITWLSSLSSAHRANELKVFSQFQMMIKSEKCVC